MSYIIPKIDAQGNIIPGRAEFVGSQAGQQQFIGEPKGKAIVSESSTEELGDFNDTQEAIDYVNSLGGGEVYLKVGTYTLSSDLTLYSNINLLGEGRQTIIRGKGINLVGTLVSNTGTFAINGGSSAVTGTNSTFSDDGVAEDDVFWINLVPYHVSSITNNTSLTLKETFRGANVSGESVQIERHKSNILIKNIEFSEISATGEDLIDCQYISNITFDNVWFRKNTVNSNVRLRNFFNSRFLNCVLQDTKESSGTSRGAVLEFGSNSLFAGNSLVGNQHTGIIVSAAGDISFVQNFFSHNGGASILIGDGWECPIIGNVFHENDATGAIAVHLNGGDRCPVSGNIFKNNATAITLDTGLTAATANILTYNTLNGNTTDVSDSGIGTIRRGNSDGIVSPSFSVTKNDAQALTSGQFDRVLFDDEDYDYGGVFASYRFTCVVPGQYEFDAGVAITNVDDGKECAIALYKNGTEIRRGDRLQSAAANQTLDPTVSATLNLAATDYIEVWAYHNSGAGVILEATAALNYFNGKLAG